MDRQMRTTLNYTNSSNQLNVLSIRGLTHKHLRYALYGFKSPGASRVSIVIDSYLHSRKDDKNRQNVNCSLSLLS